jgi:hypothetical protein
LLQVRQLFWFVLKGLVPRIFFCVGRQKRSRNVIQTDVADKMQLVGLLVKSRDCEVVVELITVPGNFLQAWGLLSDQLE